MKKICYIIVFLSFVACKWSEQETESFDKVLTKMPETWQEQVEYAKNKTVQLTEQGIDEFKFVGYNYLGKITSQEQIDECWKQLLADETQVVMFPNKSDHDMFDIVPLKQKREQIWELYKQDMAEYYKQSLDTLVTFGTELIELEWEYKGKPYNSLGIIYHGKIVFDHIGSAVVLPGTRPPKAKMVFKKRKLRSEEEMLQRIKE